MRRPTFCSSLDDDPATPRSSTATADRDKDKESRLTKVKRMITDSILLGRRKKECDVEKENHGSGSGAEPVLSVCLRKESGFGNQQLHIEVAGSATTEIVLKPRKRKERLDSGGSINLETKVIRSSSEERAVVKPDGNVRRVWSHDELKVLAEVNGSKTVDHSSSSYAVDDPPLISGSSGNMRERKPGPPCEDLEARRSSERFSRAGCAAPRRRKVSRRAPPPDRDPSPPASTNKLDVSTLHRQVDGSEPMPSRTKVLSPDDEPESPAVEALISPRNSLVMRLEYLDPSLPPSPPQMHLHALRQQDKQERRLIKQISSIKRQIKRYEEGFKVEFGYKPSPADKMANKDIRRLISDLSRLKLQHKQMKEEENSSSSVEVEAQEDKRAPAGSPTKPIKFTKSIEDAVQDVHKRLEEKREGGGRNIEISDMTAEQLLEEKLAVQKALLTLENAFGRPVAQRDRDLVRPLYQRYRALKRLVVRSSTGKLNSSASELATILEHEAMEFSPSASMEGGDEPVAFGEIPVTPQEEIAIADDAGPSSSSSDSLAENLHALPLSQLLEQQKRLKEEKKTLRRNLREFDEEFLSKTGRRAQKQDRLVIETIYLGYKQSKAKLRLLEALIAKKSQVKRNSC